jgi:hypothetical protein
MNRRHNSRNGFRRDCWYSTDIDVRERPANRGCKPKPAESIQIGYPAFLQGNRHPLVGVFPTLTLVANYLLCIESFAPDAIFNCEDQDLRPAQPSRGALAECGLCIIPVGDCREPRVRATCSNGPTRDVFSTKQSRSVSRATRPRIRKPGRGRRQRPRPRVPSLPLRFQLIHPREPVLPRNVDLLRRNAIYAGSPAASATGIARPRLRPSQMQCLFVNLGVKP